MNIVNCSQDDNIIISPLKNSTSDDDFLKIQCITSDCSKNEHFLLQKMFFRWLELTKNRKLLRKILLQWKITCLKKDSEVTTQKIDKFIETLQKRLEEKKINHATLHKENNRNTHGVQKSKSTVISPECHKSRFKAQQEIIELQKSKLVEQTKIIEDLKLGIIQDELEKSLKNTKNEIREIFSNCSNRIKCKTVPTEALIQNALANLIINSNKAPKFLQQMEKRALERAKNRQIILERKRLIDEEKKRLIREAIEKKQAQDEEEKKRNLEAIKERRRLDFELQKQRQINKEKYLASLKKAENYHRRKLLRTAIGSFLYNVYVAHNNHNKSESFYENKIKAKCFKAWIQFIENKYKPGFDKAITFCNAKLILKAFGVWKSVSAHFTTRHFHYKPILLQFHKEAIRSLQVAIDYYDMQLATKTFIHWHRYVCIQITKRERNEQKAQKHYNR